MKKIVLAFLLALFAGVSSAQLVHTKGQMSFGVRGGGAYHGWNVGLMYDYNFNNQIALLVEVDRESAKFEFSDFNNKYLFGVGANFNIWNPKPSLYFQASVCGNMGYDVWKCNVVDWTHEYVVFGANAGLGLEIIPWNHVSLLLKGRQWILFGGGDSYAKPDYSLGLKINW